MKCPSCNAEGGAGKFCRACGKPMPAAPACPACGAELSGGAKFCLKCGARLGAPVSTPPAPEAPPSEPERVITIAPPGPVVAIKQPSAPAPAKVGPAAAPDEPLPIASGKGPVIAILLIVAIIAGGVIWWFVVRGSAPAKAPIEKGPLYSVPAGSGQ